jgi:hypothetical protein
MMVIYLLYELALTGVGHSVANLPFDRPVTPPANSNLSPFASTGDQRAMTIAMKAKINNSTFSEFFTVIPSYSIDTLAVYLSMKYI